MTTKNVRVVGYLPPPYHEKLREYMQSQMLTESAALVRIVKQFFNGSTESQLVADKDDAIAQLRADMVQLQKRLGVLEEAFVSGRRFNSAKSRRPYQSGPPPVLPPQTSSELARRMGVNANTVEEAYQQGEDYFKNWSRRMDPMKRSWRKRGELFHPESD